MIEEKQMTEMIPSGLVKISDMLIIRPSEIACMYLYSYSSDGDSYNTKILFRDGTIIKTEDKIEDIMKKLSHPGHL